MEGRDQGVVGIRNQFDLNNTQENMKVRNFVRKRRRSVWKEMIMEVQLNTMNF